MKRASVIRGMVRVWSLRLCFRSIRIFKVVKKGLIKGTKCLICLVIISNTTVRGISSRFKAMGARVGLHATLFLTFLSMRPIHVSDPSRRCPAPSRMDTCLIIEIKQRARPLIIVTRKMVLMVNRVIRRRNMVMSIKASVNDIRITRIRRFLRYFSRNIFVCSTITYSEAILLILHGR